MFLTTSRRHLLRAISWRAPTLSYQLYIQLMISSPSAPSNGTSMSSLKAYPESPDVSNLPRTTQLEFGWTCWRRFPSHLVSMSGSQEGVGGVLPLVVGESLLEPPERRRVEGPMTQRKEA